MNITKNLIIDKKRFNKILDCLIKNKRKPTMLAFLTPNYYLYDLLRLIKLSEFHSNNFYIYIVLNEQGIKNTQYFKNLIESLIPFNKQLFDYSDLCNNIDRNESIVKLRKNININQFNKRKKDIDLLSLSIYNLNNYINQFYLINNSEKFLGFSPDFILTTPNKDLIFQTISKDKKMKNPISIILNQPSYNPNLSKSIEFIQAEFLHKGFDERKISKLKRQLESYGPYLKIEKNIDYINILIKLKNLLKIKPLYQEIFSNKENFRKYLFILNNAVRRKIISIIYKHNQIKAESIRKILNEENEGKNISLPGIIKNLRLLLDSDIIKKNERYYSIKSKRVIFNLPIDWFGKD